MPQLTTRARFYMHRLVLSKVEALLRRVASLSGVEHTILLVEGASRLSAHVSMLLHSDERYGAAAVAAHYSIVATVRKILCRVDALMPDGPYSMVVRGSVHDVDASWLDIFPTMLDSLTYSSGLDGVVDRL